MKASARLLLTLVLSLGFAAHAQNNKLVENLTETFTPITIQTTSATRWVTMEGQLEIPTRYEEHLLFHLFEMWQQDGFPESFEKLKADFDALPAEETGYPVLVSGAINQPVAAYWVKRQLRMHPAFADGGKYEGLNALNLVIDEEKSQVDEERGVVNVVYRIRLQVTPTDNKRVEDNDFVASLPKNLHEQFFQTVGAGALKEEAIKALAAEQLPAGRLKWRALLNSVKNSCLGDDAISGILTLDQFLQSFNTVENKCYLTRDAQVKTAVTSVEMPQKSAKAYPEFHELYKDGKLSVLVVLQLCKEEDCVEGALNSPTQFAALRTQLADFGYKLKSRDGAVQVYSRNTGSVEVELTLIGQSRPTFFEDSFWENYPRNEVVVTNRLPMLNEHFNRIYVPMYQMLVSPELYGTAWGRILPILDYKLENFDGVETAVNQLAPAQVLGFVESIVQAGSFYNKDQKSWNEDPHWSNLLKKLETAGESPSAHFVRGNNFVPGNKSNKYAPFDNKPSVADYVSLLNTQNPRGTDFSDAINHRLAVLYLTLFQGEQISEWTALRNSLQDICKNQITNKNVTRWYFFGRDCSPRYLLTSGQTEINGIRWARSSYISLYYGKAGIAKEAYLAAPTKIGELVYKSYYQDTAGVLKFHKNGQLMQGHLANHQDYLGLPLNGGRGTSMVRWHDNGKLYTAQLRVNAPYTIKGQKLVLRGHTRGPHQVKFYPTGELECAYLAKTQRFDGYDVAGYESNLGDVKIDREDTRVCFHPNGNLRSAVLAAPFKKGNVEYPVGTVLAVNPKGQLTSPVYQLTGADEYHWGAKFPEGSLFIPAKDGNPEWIRLNGELKIKNHYFPAGSEITFRESGYFLKVKAPKNGRPRIAFVNNTLSVPEGATLYFERHSPEASGLDFDQPVEIGGITYLPSQSERERTLELHGNGRVAEGVIASDVSVKEPHYGTIPLKGETTVRFTEEGTPEQFTLGSDYTFNYKVLDDSEIPEGQDKTIKALSFARGTVIELSSQAKVERATVAQTWTQGSVVVNEGGQVSFDEAHNPESFRFAKTGGKIGAYAVAEGAVRLYKGTTVPEAVVLAAPARVGNIQVAAGATLRFFASGKLKEVIAPENTEIVVELEGMKLTRQISFYESGKVKSAFLKEDFTYSNVKIASLSKCLQIRVMKPDERAESCSVSFYEDGKSIMRGISAEDFQTSQGKVVKAGQPVEFLEDGTLFLN